MGPGFRALTTSFQSWLRTNTDALSLKKACPQCEVSTSESAKLSPEPTPTQQPSADQIWQRVLERAKRDPENWSDMFV